MSAICTPISFEEHMKRNTIDRYSLSELPEDLRVSSAALPPSIIEERVAKNLQEVPWELVQDNISIDGLANVMTFIEYHRHQIESLIGRGSFFISKKFSNGLSRTLLVDQLGSIHVLLKIHQGRHSPLVPHGCVKVISKAVVVGQRALRAFASGAIRKTRDRSKRLVIKKDDEKMCLSEELIGQRFRNTPHVVHYFEVFYYCNKNHHRQGILMPYYSGGTLETLISPVVQKDRRMLEILLGVVKGIKAISAHHILHRDIKPENILLDQQPDGTLVSIVADFGLAVTPDAKFYWKDIPGPIGYTAPEIHRLTETRDPEDLPELLKHVTTKIDVYSAGIMFGELTLAMEPIYDYKKGVLNEMYTTWKQPTAEEFPWEHLVWRMTRKDLQIRPDIGQVEEKMVAILEQLPPTL